MQPNTHQKEPETVEGEVVDMVPVIPHKDRGEVDTQIATAKMYPRSIKRAMENAVEMATLDEETAASCMYGVPRGGKIIEGPSIRFASILASCWGNMRVSARPVGMDDKFVSCQGMAWDLEKNVAFGAEVRRRITDSKGRRYNDDMIGTTSNAGSSIAMRNAILKCVPEPLWKQVYQKVRKVAVGEADTLAQKRAGLLEYFGKMGVIPPRIFALLDVAGVEEVTLDHLATLRALATAIKDGEVKIDEAFPEVTMGGKPAAASKTESIKNDLKAKAEAAKAEAQAQGGDPQ